MVHRDVALPDFGGNVFKNGLIASILILCVFSSRSFAVKLDVDVEYQCIQRCPLQNQTDEGHYELDCGYDCSINKCIEGCKLWKKSLESSCQTVCNGTLEPLSPKELYCVMGCNDASTRYFSQLRAKLGTPPAPALVADSLTATSLSLEWNFPEAKDAGLTYFVQWRYEELAASWQYCRNQTWGPHDTVFVDNLQPYTKYRFRVALLLSQHSEPIVSAPSVVISTLPAGVPASPPSRVRAVAIDSTRISVNWEPGPFPHGPLLSFVLRITENSPQGYSALKDIPSEKTFYMFRNLEPSRNYTVSIAMRNGVGAGPPAKCLVSTPPAPTVKEDQQPVLVLGADHVVIEQGTDMLEEPVLLYNTSQDIKGISIHINQRLLFVADDNGKVHRMPLAKFTNRTRSTIILAPPNINFKPLDLSVDWLNNQLYVLGEVEHQQLVWQVARCNLDGRGLQVAVAGLRTKPHHIEVDPYNGFLFWVVRGSQKGGLYRLDLSDISNGIKHEITPELILAEPNLGAFTVDHTNFRLLVSDQSKSTINSVSLDGKEINNLRPKIIKSRMQKVLSLATANKKFYWTDGRDVLYEEYHPSYDSYFHNSYPDLTKRPYLKVFVNLPSSQPTPIPVNPPTSLQIIFGSKLAKASWKSPHLLGGQGKGAWQNWTYEISIKDSNNTHVATYKNINSTTYVIEDLKEDMEYVVKAAAYTNLGKGPWSSEFRGRSLKDYKHGKHPEIIWSTSEGLLKSDATGENVETLIPKGWIKNHYVTDIASYKEQIYLVTNNSQIFWYNLQSHSKGQLLDVDSVGSVAIDWIGKKLYWSNPKQHLIIRGNLNGTQQEPLPILTLAKELNIDAVEAYLYWSTGHAVECSHLNGANKLTYHPAQPFSGKQVMGLTLDTDQKMVYWIVRSSEGANLFRAPMAQNKIAIKPQPEKVSSLQKPNMQGPLCYFNNRLVWLEDEKSAVISDLEGKNTASINGKGLSGLMTFYVMDSSQYILPNISKKYESLHVIPEPVQRESIRTVGLWDSFNITWKPSQKVNYGIVFYEVKVDSLLQNGTTKFTTVPYIEYWQLTTPFSKLNVAIRAFTYWGTSPLVRAKIYSPPSTPSAPVNLRLYVTKHKHPKGHHEVRVIFRWDPPLFSNGIIQGYNVKCWYILMGINIDECEDAIIKPNEKEHFVYELMEDKIYYFQVQAFTEVGRGEMSEIASVNTSNEFPVPKLLVASTDSIFVQDVDINENYTLLHGINTPIEIAYVIKEDKLFWINDMQELLMFNFVNSNRSKIADINGDGISLTVDWLERSLYYIQKRSNEEDYSVQKLNLNHFDKGLFKIVEVFRRANKMYTIEVSPFTRKLYWTEEVENGEYILMQSDTDGLNIRPFFPSSIHRKRDTGDDLALCNCPLGSSVEKTFTVDHYDLKAKPTLIFIDSPTHKVMTTDKNGCRCDQIANNSVLNNSFPLQRLKSDLSNIYWTNSTAGSLYFLNRNRTNVTNHHEINAQDIRVFGTHMQPYPPNKCLIPNQDEPVTPLIFRKTSSLLTLIMPDTKNRDECENISMATTEYTIYYKLFKDGEPAICDTSCTQLTTFDKIVTIEGLKPFSKYLISLAIGNYFSNLIQVRNVGPTMIFQTLAGAPSKPEIITASVLNPTLAEIIWSPPTELNGEFVWYEVHWQTESTINGIRQKGEKNVIEPERTGNYFTTKLQRLVPNETYSIWVRAYSETNDTSSDSDNIIIKMFPEPENIRLLNFTAYELHIQWELYEYAENYTIQYAPLISNDWYNVESITSVTGNNTAIITIRNLEPKTQYKLRLLLKYPLYDSLYVWPKDSRYTFETKGDRPSPPGTPVIQYVKADVYHVWWEASKSNGAPIEMYLLECMKLQNYRVRRSTNRTAWYYSAPSIDEQVFEWVPLYNGTETFWNISGLNGDSRYTFRVSALNMYGWSDYSQESMEFDWSVAAQLAQKPSLTYIVIATSIPVGICFVFIVCIIVLSKAGKHNCLSEKTKLVTPPPRGPDVELATLRELPRRGIHNTNVLYISTQITSDEIAMLPHINRDKIKLMKFLGSGAFGEVFEGKAKNITDDGSEIPVAVKTLRKGAPEQEKTEFLQEAQLMSHFKHEHILQLLGVCLDNDPHFIIMELMEGGDLLTYLRSSRKLMRSTLTLVELLKMCVDVAKGCRYLEEMHFVHRDLACRNCLVSSTDPETRIVKIGDFGLARDIYKNDYYRKEGEGLLPVRWMAPESLVDGVFTCLSDVWAFGVLLWEIMTLGQQPYPARNNLEVLHYVKSGGRLGKPTDCPEKLHDLMLKCWSYEPERRPTFKYCLSVLEELYKEIASSPVTGAHEGIYISSVPQAVPEGVTNQVYFQDENHNSGVSWKSTSDGEGEKEKTPFLRPAVQDRPNTALPEYLELLHNSADDNDGYEIPRASIRSEKSVVTNSVPCGTGDSSNKKNEVPNNNVRSCEEKNCAHPTYSNLCKKQDEQTLKS